MPSETSAVVVGAGVSGLTTAMCLAEAGASVRIWAARPPQETTSAVAGAMWGPSFARPAARAVEWTRRSLDDFRRLAADPRSGIRLAPALTVGDLPAGSELHPEVELIPGLRPARRTDLPTGFPAGFLATMPLVDMPRYLDYLVEWLRTLGVEIETRAVRSLAEAAGEAPIVLNCSGLGARELAGDDTLRPVFGQHVVLANPGVDRLFMELSAATEWTSYLPHPGRVVCGGTRIPDRWDTTPDPALTERIVGRCRRVEPRLRDAEVLGVAVGLRPYRPVVRVEAEQFGASRCVHNYGHGGNGVSLSWGCARDAAALALGR